MTNFLDRPIEAEVSLVMPPGWIVQPERARLALPAGGKCSAPFGVEIPASYVFRYPRAAIAAEVTFDGRRLGQITEATVERVSR
jgi:hypothetical protein